MVSARVGDTPLGRPSLKEDCSSARLNSLSKRQMESLAAICDTFLPSVNPPPGADDDIASFYRTSPSMAGNTLEQMGGMVSGGFRHPELVTLRWVLLMLSTWFGTLLFCGRRSLSPRFPFVRRFKEMGQEKREEALLSWATSCFLHLRMLYVCLKCTTMRLYFGQVNEKMENPSWKAIGYCGPDPSRVGVSQTTEETHQEPVHLHSAVLQMDRPPELIARKLRQAGFPAPSMHFGKTTLYCDAAIIGSGSGGSVVAGILAAAGHKVLVIEKGYCYSSNDLSLLEGPTYAAMYENGGLIATDDVSMLILAGSTVGGGSTINWSASMSTPENVRSEWCNDHRLELFGSKAFDAAVDAVCRRIGVQAKVNEEGFNNAILRRGCEAAGYPVSAVPCNAPPDHYCGWCHLGCKDGKKQSTPETWLKDMACSGNGLILPGCQVVKILKSPGKIRTAAAGVLVESSEGYQFTINSKVTVVACGAMNTPRLLKKSGLKNKHIGRNLHLHPTVMAWGYFPESSGWPEKEKRSYQGGILTSMSRPESTDVVLQTPALHPGMFAALVPWLSSADFRQRMLRFSRTAHVFALVRDKGSGAVDYPGSVSLRLSEEDEKAMRQGLEAAVRVMAAAGAEEVGTQWVGGARGRGSEGVETVLRGVRGRRMGDLRTPICSAHQMGSCRMGATAAEGAVGPDGEAWEMEGLFVADSSVFPTALGVNPMVTVMAVAYCIAQGIHEVLTGKKKDQQSLGA